MRPSSTLDGPNGPPYRAEHQISQEKVLSWFLPLVPTRLELGNGGPKKRFIYVFENLPASTPATDVPAVNH